MPLGDVDLGDERDDWMGLFPLQSDIVISELMV